MKRTVCILLFAALLLGLWGCSHNVDAPKEPVQFYYPRQIDHLQYSTPEGAITYELRESAGHTGQYTYLLNLYLRGPMTQELRDPFPAGTSVISLKLEPESAELILTDSFAQLTGMDLTVACASLTLTVHSLLGVDTLSITTENRKLEPDGVIVMELDRILFMDSSTEQVRD